MSKFQGRWTGFVAALLFLCVALPVFAKPTFPTLTGRVVDEAGILSDGTRTQLTSMLAQQEQRTGVQVVVVTLKSLGGYEISDYGYQLGRAWGIGQKGKNTGALLIVVPSEHKVRIEVGYGLEGQLTDAQSKIIIDEIMTPAFRTGDYDGGVLAGTTAILKTIGGATITTAPQGDGADRQGAGHGGSHIPWFIILILIWILFGRFFWPLFFLGGMGGGWGGGRGGGDWGGGSGGGGFSGGGGSFGGGGASGSW
jgi:uncharacterized protein